ncbi:tRNA preQ1(34) S-adenosylmethionine ribosyltransferase-isomerase QueA, partial [Candidatus Peregrinibacteria bacterium]|nr:tRNA preQ1(34) S-adenosylmethionine ribosyltransferase-isomerase QueA [Candidatus Peregrinibacteria bacterium]
MKVEELNYDLPKEFIAQKPLDKRDDSKLLILDRATGKVEHSKFAKLPEFLRKGDLLVLNNTKVLPARIFTKRKTGGKVEVLILANTIRDAKCEALLGTPRRLKVGEAIFTDGNAEIKIVEKLMQGRWLLEFSGNVFDIMCSCGVPPLPPYIKRDATKGDFERYQTIYAQNDGSIAAPTAGLHFTKELLNKLETKYITLHVGLGTFSPVEVEDLSAHKMLEEGYQISDEVASSIKKAKQENRRIVAVGTTTVRALE